MTCVMSLPLLNVGIKIILTVSQIHFSRLLSKNHLHPSCVIPSCPNKEVCDEHEMLSCVSCSCYLRAAGVVERVDPVETGGRRLTGCRTGACCTDTLCH